MKQNTNRRYKLLLAALVFTLAITACVGSGQPHNQELHSQANGNDAIVNVTLQEMSISLDSSQLKAGTITFVVTNNGFMDHDFAIRGNGVDQKTLTLNSGESATLTVNLEPGTYTYICTMPGHEQGGMTGTFIVSENS
jgi:uncharacterized cupredoxin-like copper-binding protein